MPEHIFHIRTLAWHIVFTLCLPALLFAQPSAIYTESEAEAYNDLLRDLEGISLELNRASAKDLLILPGLTPELARRIIARRPYRTLAELAHFGLPTNRFPLWKHQEQALRAAWDEEGHPRNLIVATGTGSGKTECFYLPILSDILRESINWPTPTGEATAGKWNGQLRTWLHKRRHETRPAAIRAIVLYPMNALGNDQLRPRDEEKEAAVPPTGNPNRGRKALVFSEGM